MGSASNHALGVDASAIAASPAISRRHWQQTGRVFGIVRNLRARADASGGFA
jgi:hypothetical protein